MASVPYDTMSFSSRDSPLMKKCCCFIPLRTGCFILGYLNLVFNTIHTLALLTLTTVIGISSHGFDHFDSDRIRIEPVNDVESVDKSFLNEIGIVLLVVLCANCAWLFVNVVCIVGLHKKRPGPIRIYIAFATIRVVLTLAGLVYITVTANPNLQTIIANAADICLAGYFILVYYVYAGKLEKEILDSQRRESVITDISFIYPIKSDKQNLVA